MRRKGEGLDRARVEGRFQALKIERVHLRPRRISRCNFEGGVNKTPAAMAPGQGSGVAHGVKDRQFARSQKGGVSRLRLQGG